MAFKTGKEIEIGTTEKLFDLLYLMEFHSATMHQSLPRCIWVERQQGKSIPTLRFFFIVSSVIEASRVSFCLWWYTSHILGFRFVNQVLRFP